ncbi:solute carrier family 23 member 1-like [Tachypleus tridentatus]|uniref:solute carrier family 23 member 1-like n=1 Tax=Tachypleus tridentatus TaxID=6853 RepID=UPI003FD31D65
MAQDNPAFELQKETNDSENETQTKIDEIQPGQSISYNDQVHQSIQRFREERCGVIYVLLEQGLPTIQGSSSTFLVPIFAILSLHQWKCPGEEEILSATEEVLQEILQIRMREIQDTVIVASIFEMGIGFTGVVGVMLQ